MKRRVVVGATVAAVALGAAGVGVAVAGSGGVSAVGSGYGSGYGAGYGSGNGSAGTTTVPAAPSAGTLTSRTTRLGPTLVDGSGRTLYLFASDSATISTCSGSCTSVWPPAGAAAEPVVTGGARPDLIGTLRRTDGTTQLTYAGHPLYYYAGDAVPGDTTGQGLDQFGAPWYALTPGGGTIGTH